MIIKVQEYHKMLKKDLVNLLILRDRDLANLRKDRQHLEELVRILQGVRAGDDMVHAAAQATEAIARAFCDVTRKLR